MKFPLFVSALSAPAGLQTLDYVIIGVYLVTVIALGKLGSKHTGNQEGFFLADRKLGKLYQFLLNFGNSTDSNGAVSSASLVYQQGVSGVWLGFQMIFLNPYYWFMNSWFRRVRLVTTADLFTERLGSRGLGSFYALFQSVSAMVVVIGFGNLVTYKICSALVVKPPTEWSRSVASTVCRPRKQIESPVEKPECDSLGCFWQKANRTDFAEPGTSACPSKRSGRGCAPIHKAII